MYIGPLGWRDASGQVLLVVVAHYCRWMEEIDGLFCVGKEAETTMAVRGEEACPRSIWIYTGMKPNTEGTNRRR